MFLLFAFLNEPDGLELGCCSGRSLSISFVLSLTKRQQSPLSGPRTTQKGRLLLEAAFVFSINRGAALGDFLFRKPPATHWGRSKITL